MLIYPADLIDDGGEARQVDIAARLGVAQPTVAKMLKRLESLGLVRRSSDPADRRSKLVRLTETGKQVEEEAFETFVALSKDLSDQGELGATYAEPLQAACRS